VGGKQKPERHADKCEMCARSCKQPATVEVVGCPSFILCEPEPDDDPQESAENSKVEVS